MAVKDSYSKARATKSSKEFSAGNGSNLSKRQQNKIKKTILKSPVLVISILFLIVGAVGGFFAFKFLSPFEMKGFKVNGVVSAENDYVIIDMSNLKEQYMLANTDAEMEDFYASISIEDLGFECKFFGVDMSKTVTKKYCYREDISHETQEVSEIDLETPGVYYIEYTSSHFAFKNKTLIRTIIVTGVENDG